MTDPIRALLDQWDRAYYLHGTPAYPIQPNSMQGRWALSVDALRAVLDIIDNAPASISAPPADCNNSCSDGPCTCSGVMRPLAWRLDPDDIRRAIAEALGVPL